MFCLLYDCLNILSVADVFLHKTDVCVVLSTDRLLIFYPTVAPTINPSRCKNNGLQYVQETADSPFHVSRAQVSHHHKRATKRELRCLRVGVYKVLKHYRETDSIGRKVGSGRPSK